jgi:hypothetical protein
MDMKPPLRTPQEEWHETPYGERPRSTLFMLDGGREGTKPLNYVGIIRPRTTRVKSGKRSD